MRDGDFADGLYWILHAINYKLGGDSLIVTDHLNGGH